MDESEYAESLKVLEEIYSLFTRKEKRFEKPAKRDLRSAVFQRLLQVMFLIDPLPLIRPSALDSPPLLPSQNGRSPSRSYAESARESLRREFLADRVSADCRNWVCENWESIFVS